MDKPPALTEIRKAISAIDKDMLALLAQRKHLALDVARSKEVDIRPIRDTQREKELLARLVKQGREQGLDAHFVLTLYQTIIEDSVLSQQAFLQGRANPDVTKQQYCVAYLGARGSYSHLAATRYCQRRSFEMLDLGCQSFDEIINAVESGHADYGFLPIENTSSGSINEVYDLLQHTSLAIVGETTIEVGHCLLAKPGTKLEQVTTLFAHPQPISQCSRYLSQHKDFKLEYCASSADAMDRIMHSDRTDIAAIGSAQGGEFYGLEVLQNNLANQKVNQSRFIVVARKAIAVPEQLPAKTTLIMATGHKPGALVDALLVLKQHKLNMSKLESRPIAGTPWEEMFYLDIEANLRIPAMESTLKELAELTRFIKVLGCYPCETVEPTQLSQKQLMIEPDTSKTEQHLAEQAVDIKVRQFALGQGHLGMLASLDVDQALMNPGNLAKSLKEQGFQGLVITQTGQQALEEVITALDSFDLCSVVEVTHPGLLTSVAHADILYIGSDNMYNTALLEQVGTLPVPVILERHPDAETEALQQAVSALQQSGNRQVILAESGFETRSGKRVLDIGYCEDLQQELKLPLLINTSNQVTNAASKACDGLILAITPGEDYRSQLAAWYC
ncbi:chorismate mutase [Shewanella submarina]|uniref:Chorismate mutase n=1 Tax=Shewanella submarina TaxID=2016376 RepID=A0ABV7GE17_9GAMM|nr:chorismate mutase [Shewanella submarina]MCL1036902.1 chorismate mutase [Shewanella submarina]